MRVMALANLYRADHVARLSLYRPLNPAASSWNTALFNELAQTGLDLHVVQFLPIKRGLKIEEKGLTFHYLPQVPGLDKFTSLLKRARVAALVREIRPDVIHGIGSEHGYAWPAVGQGVPSVITIHGYMKVINRLSGHTSVLKQLFLVREENRALRHADRVIAINEYMRGHFTENGCEPANAVIVPNALNPAFLQPFDEPESRGIDILMVGTLHRLKNQHVALDLFARLKQAHGLTPRVTIVGASTAESRVYEAELRAAVVSLGLDHVVFAGKKSPTELASIYRSSRFLLHISDFEADPTVVAEALACGALPVVNPVAGLAFRVQDGENGFHLPILDRAVAASRLADILGDESPRVALAVAGKRKVMEERRPRGVAEATLQVYRSLVSPPRQAAAVHCR
jgi:glycosyltransferase involved in cell wall biosynthesis